MSIAFTSTEIEIIETSSERSKESESSIYEKISAANKVFSTRIATKLVSN